MVPSGVDLGGDMSDEILLTYAELSERLSIKQASAKRLAQRRKWTRVVGNDGVARVRVPVSLLSRRVVGDVADDVTPDITPSVVGDMSSRIAHIEGLLEGLRGQVDAERRRAEAAEARIKDVEQDREAWKAQAQRGLWQRLFGG